MYFFTLYERNDGGPVNELPPEKQSWSITFKDDGKSSVNERFYSCERLGKNNYIQHGFENLAQKLKNSGKKEILLYIHGFNNYPEDDVFPNAEKLQTLCNKHLDSKFEVIPVLWPCRDKFGAVRDYFSDQDVADATRTAINRALNYLLEWQRINWENSAPCFKKINILAHSMGNRVLVEGLDGFAHTRPGGLPSLFKNIFMVAADVANEVLEREKKGRHIPAMAKNVVTYFAYDDAAMPASKVANTFNGEFSRRLGLSGPERWSEEHLSDNVFGVDCCEYNNQYDPIGHTYFMESNFDGDVPVAGKIFEHIASVLRTGVFDQNPEKRLIRL